MPKVNITRVIITLGQILAYIMAILLAIEIVKKIFGGSWRIEDIILALVIFNLTATFTIGGFLINLSNKISEVNTKIEKHSGWHNGVNNHPGKKSKKH